MKKLILLIVAFVMSSGCNEKDLYFKNITMDELDKEISTFFLNQQNENGVYLFQDQGERIYVFLNGWNVKQGEAAPTFSNFEIEPDGDTLRIHFEEQLTTDYENKEVDNRLIYEIRFDRNYESLAIFKNGKETHFDVSSGR